MNSRMHMTGPGLNPIDDEFDDLLYGEEEPE